MEQIESLVINQWGLTHAEMWEFEKWAFGPSYFHYTYHGNDLIHLMNLWNERHKELLEINPEGVISKDIPKMIEIWKKSLNPVETILSNSESIYLKESPKEHPQQSVKSMKTKKTRK